MGNRITYFLFIAAVSTYGCKKAFNPVVASGSVNNLVVEGLINVGNDSTIIKLSRSVVVASKTAVNPELKATVTVENSAGTSYPIPETALKGTYAAPSLHLSASTQYRLRIKTVNGKTYLSDLVTPKVTPPIDSVGFLVKPTGLQVYVNAHDASNTTRYYKYAYRETWQFAVRYQSNYISDGTKIIDRTPAQQISFCFGTDTAAHTIVNSTAALAKDVVYQFPINDIVSTSEKLETKYSILVSQVALSKEAYDFWTALEKNTESLGSIFDAQPSILVGNIHNVADASEPVIGYISAATVEKKRIYITKPQLPQSFLRVYPFGCQLEVAWNTPQEITYPPYWAKNALIWPGFIGNVTSIISMVPPETYEFSTIECTDCTIRGVTKQPSFWK